MVEPSGAFLERCLFLDLELDGEDRIAHLGAVLGADRRVDHRDPERDAWAELDALAADADFLAGHNLIAFDQGHLAKVSPGSRAAALPVIDTLCLAPLAFPEVPYHHLVKDYKQVRESINDPVRDSEISREVLADLWDRLGKLDAAAPAVLALYRHSFRQKFPDSGFDALFAAIGAEEYDPGGHPANLADELRNRACPGELRRVLAESTDNPAASVPLVYVIAWLRVAGTGSILPHWVRKEYPLVRELVRRLREVHCGDEACVFCERAHSPAAQLKSFFGFDSFRPIGGRDLQEQIVAAGMSDEPLLAILPTGAGKSLCYQLPALVRHDRTGALSIVISPLQALMKDQVDNLRKGSAAAALNGLLTPPERGRVMEEVRLGYTSLLYVSPEQLRNRSFGRAIAQREIGCWIFDEAHCLSKWGHDFRPDYLYAGRFIREFAEGQGVAPPPVACFTATAKQDVKEEILEYFRAELGQTLHVFEASVNRENLRFDVEHVSEAQKMPRIREILSERLNGGSAIVFCATRRRTREFAEFLGEGDPSVEAFHAGIDAQEKREIQDRFTRGEIRVICATNAFGMGIDKDDVRLVVHADIPGSLENYLQEAGRAGRDRDPADCVLLFTPEDLETQFGLEAKSEVSRHDIQQILTGLRNRRKKGRDEVVLTPGELLRSDAVETEMDPSERGADTKVKTAVSWLERGKFLARNENHTRVFQGRPKVASIEEALRKMDELKVSPAARRRWELLLGALFNAPKDGGLGVDELAEVLGFRDRRKHGEGPAPGENILRTLHDMAEHGLIEKGLQLTAFLKIGVRNDAKGLFKKLCDLDRGLIEIMEEEAPDAGVEEWQEASLRHLNQRLLDRGHEHSNVELVRRLLLSLSQDGAGELSGGRGSMAIRPVGPWRLKVRLQRKWADLKETASRRRMVAKTALSVLLAIAKTKGAPRGEVSVSFSTEDIARDLRQNDLFEERVGNILGAIDRALLFLHEQRVITLEKGLAVFRQAMTISLRPENTRYTNQDYGRLKEHYEERVFQIHVMGRYAEIGREGAGPTREFVAGYFELPKPRFIEEHLPRAAKTLARRTSSESFESIVTSLRNKVQERLVSAPENRNQLVLAGSGSGKTRVVVHRCAYLLRVLRVPARGILVVCFNRSAAWQIRRRLKELVGRDARGVTVQTYHGLAARILGYSFAAAENRETTVRETLDGMVEQAAAVLGGEVEQVGLEPDEVRERLLEGYRHILVDEYQDIDTHQFDLVSAIAGRREKDPASKLTIMAVGDDDQNIYAWRGANVEFIRRFAEQYGTEPTYLVENYRSSKSIIDVANAFIARNDDRMKKDQPIRVTRARKSDSPGSAVRCVTVADGAGQAAAVVGELADRPDPSACALLARTHEELASVRHACESAGIPVRWIIPTKSVPPLTRIREVHALLEYLKKHRREAIRKETIEDRIAVTGDWNELLARTVDAWADESGGEEASATAILEFFYEALAQERFGAGIGHGVHLSTIHAAKGMEFAHVYLLDGGWKPPKNERETEEERRVFYVGMTRAEKTLTVLRRADERSAHLTGLPGVVEENAAKGDAAYSAGRRSYAMLGMKDLFLDYAGWRPASDPIHRRLSELTPGSPLTAVAQREAIVLLDEAGLEVARLSKAAAGVWTARLPDLDAIRVVAMIRREKVDQDPAYAENCVVEAWEVPLVEVRWRG